MAFDTEGNGLDREFINGDGRTNGFSLAIRIAGQYYSDYFPIGHIRGNNLPEWYWRPILDQVVKTKKVVFVNTNYDRRSAATIGIDPEEWDFIDLGKFVQFEDENWKQAKSLENIANKYVGEGKGNDELFQMYFKVWGWDGIASHEIRNYATIDAERTLQAFYKVLSIIQKRKEDSAIDYWFKIDQPNFDVLYKMKSRGILVDIQKCVEMENRGERRMEEIKDELGIDPGKKSDLQRIFYDELKLPVIYAKRKGRADSPTLDKSAMERYETILERLDNPIAQRILEYRGWQKSVSSYYRSYQDHVYPDGRIRTDFNSGGTVTGRYSSSKPNLQQIPKETDKPWNGEVKSVFKAQDGYELWEFDYSQLEFRLSGHFSGDRKLTEIFSDLSRDIFTEMSEDLGMARQMCKTLTYSILYGAGVQRIQDVFGDNRTQAKARIDSFYDTYPGMRKISNYVSAQAKATGKIQLWSGRYRHFPYASDAHKAYNSYVQGGAADIVKNVMNRIDKEMP